MSVLTRLRHAARFLPRVDFRNVGMLTNTLAILAKPSLKNWYYARAFVRNELPRAAKNMLLAPDDMNDFQRHSPVSAYTSSPEDGLLAGFTEHGRLSALFYPHTAFTQQVPYLETGDGHLYGSKPREGAFFGVRTGDEIAWLWEETFDHEVSARSGTGLVDVEYGASDAAPVEAAETAYVLPGEEVLVRDLVVENVSERRVESIVAYAQFNVNDEPQYPPGITNRNRASADDEVRWEDLEGEHSIRMFADAGTTISGAGVAEAPLSDFLAVAQPTVEGDYLGGYLEFDVDLAPGEETTVSVFTTGRDDLGGGADLLEGTPDERQHRVEEAWQSYTGDVDVRDIDDRFAEQYEHSVAGLLMLYDPDSGSISAAPSVQPAYYPSWPRDGAFAAIALARAGHGDVAADYLARFLPDAQEEDGAFQQCYVSTGQGAGVIPRSNDQQALYVTAVREVYRETGDREFLEAAWPAVENALAYTLDAVADNGLLRATHDFAEMWVHARQSIWTNALAFRALADGADLAEELGKERSRYREAADRLGDAVDEQFFEGPEGFHTVFSISGGEREDHTAFSAAIFPARWAQAYDRVDALLESFARAYEEAREHWLPREFLYASALYHLGEVDLGDRILEDLGRETIPGGTLAEVVDDGGDHPFAALGWSNAGFLLALQERARSSA